MSTQNRVIIVLVIVIIVVAGFLFWKSNQTAEDSLVSSTTESTENQSADQSAESEPSPAPQEQSSNPSTFEQDLAVTTWNLKSVTLDKKQVNMDVNVPAPLIISFDTAKNAYNGFSGCNNFNGTYVTSDNYGFTFGLPASTKKLAQALAI